MPATFDGDRLDIICFRHYGNLDKDNLRALIWANPDTLGIPQTFAEGVEYILPDVVEFLNHGEDKSQLFGGVLPDELT